MAKKKSNLVKTIDSQSLLVKILFCLPVINLIYGIYRIVKGIDTSNTLMIIVGICWLVIGTIAFWLIDLICVLIWGDPKLCA